MPLSIFRSSCDPWDVIQKAQNSDRYTRFSQDPSEMMRRAIAPATINPQTTMLKVRCIKSRKNRADIRIVNARKCRITEGRSGPRPRTIPSIITAKHLFNSRTLSIARSSGLAVEVSSDKAMFQSVNAVHGAVFDLHSGLARRRSNGHGLLIVASPDNPEYIIHQAYPPVRQSCFRANCRYPDNFR